MGGTDEIEQRALYLPKSCPGRSSGVLVLARYQIVELMYSTRCVSSIIVYQRMAIYSFWARAVGTPGRRPGHHVHGEAYVDQKVLQAQQWVNATCSSVAGFNPVVEDGITGWSTMYALTRALQHELGITGLTD